MFVGINYLPQRGGKNRSIREGQFYPADHYFKTFNLGINIFSTCFGTFNSEAKLKILFVSNQNIRY